MQLRQLHSLLLRLALHRRIHLLQLLCGLVHHWLLLWCPGCTGL